jgi:hypothetical protein
MPSTWIKSRPPCVERALHELLQHTLTRLDRLAAVPDSDGYPGSASLRITVAKRGLLRMKSQKGSTAM